MPQALTAMISYSTLLDSMDRTVLRVASPVAFDALDLPGGRHLRLIVNGPLTPEDAQRLGEYSQAYSYLTICIPNTGEPCEADFLKHFPHLKAFELLQFDYDDFAALEALPESLTKLSLAQTKSRRHSLTFLQRFQNLRTLHIETHSKDIEVLSHLQSLEDLTLRSITLPNLDLLRPLKNLLSLDIKLGGTKDLSALPHIGKLHYLELWMIKGITDLDSLSDVVTLQSIFLQALKHVVSLPSLKSLTRLRRVELDQMQGLNDLTPVAEAPALEDFAIGGVRHLDVAHFTPFLRHQTLRAVNVGLGSEKKNAAVQAYLGRPSFGPRFEYRYA